MHVYSHVHHKSSARIATCMHAHGKMMTFERIRIECLSRVTRSAVIHYNMAPCVQYSLDAYIIIMYLPGDILSIIMSQELVINTFGIHCNEYLTSVNKTHNLENSNGIASLTINIM